MNEQKTRKSKVIKYFILVCFLLDVSLLIYCQTNREIDFSSPSSAFYGDMTKYTIALYGSKADEVQGGREMPGRVFLLEGRGSFSWQVDIPESGNYEVALCYAADRNGSLLKVTGGNSSITGTVRKTKGYYYDSNIRWQQNFERVFLNRTLELSRGLNKISFGFLDPIPRTIMYFRSLELVPTWKKDEIRAEVERAYNVRAVTDWLVEAGYGLMLHWTSQSQPENGPHKSFAEAVNNFNVDEFIDLIEKTGAGYILFTVGHAESYCPAPIKSWDEIHPGMTTKRDLLMELADKLNKRGIKLLIYMNSPNMARMGKVSAEEYLENHRKILMEIGERYGNKIVAYCFDSWYQGYEEYPDFPFEELYRICKIGYSKRLVAFNTWILPVVTPWQDFWFGETYIPGHPPATRVLQNGPGKGLQYHSLIVLEDLWVHRNPTKMEPPWLSAKKLADYIKACMENRGAITINVGTYQEGTFGEESLAVLTSVKKLVRGE